jgi:hypothetical protein
MSKANKKICFPALLAILRKTTKAGKPLLCFSIESPIHPGSGPHFFQAGAPEKVTNRQS